MSPRARARMSGTVALALLAPLAPAAFGQAHFATGVAAYAPGGGGGIFDPSRSLGGPQGGGANVGSLHVTSLGVGGSLTLSFGTAIVDGPGADLLVFENGFYDLAFTGVHTEAAWVEVSTNGATFARFPAAYAGPAGPLDPFGTVHKGSYAGLAGGRPVLANVLTNSVPPLDPTRAGGTALDLAELAQHPAVLSGAVDLSDVRFVRLVDVKDGELDAHGVPIHDNSGPGGSADIDAVAVLNHPANQTPGRPTVELWIDDQDRLQVVFEDPDGLLDIADLRTTANLRRHARGGHAVAGAAYPKDQEHDPAIEFLALLPAFVVAELTDTRLHLVLAAPLTGAGIVADLVVTVTDSSGATCSDMVVIQS